MKPIKLSYIKDLKQYDNILHGYYIYAPIVQFASWVHGKIKGFSGINF